MKKVYNNLYVSHMYTVKNNPEYFDYIINVSGHKLSNSDFHFPLVDGDPERFSSRPSSPDNMKEQKENLSAAVQTVLKLLDDNNKTLLNCAAGISRSPTVAAIVLHIKNNNDFEEIVEQIGKPEPELKKIAKDYLEKENHI